MYEISGKDIFFLIVMKNIPAHCNLLIFSHHINKVVFLQRCMTVLMSNGLRIKVGGNVKK